MSAVTSSPPARGGAALRSAGVLVVALAACFTVAGLGSVATMLGMDGWYASLDKPSWNPPNQVFAPVWTVLYAAQGIAAWRVWRAGGPFAARPLVWFGVQLVLNLGWSVVFFALRAPEAALVEIVVLLTAIVGTTIGFFRIDRLAGWLMVPYLAWVGFATALNAAIAVAN